MPDFDVQFVGPPSITYPPWNDPAILSAPSRLNPNKAHLPNYARVTPPTTVELHAFVDNLLGPADGSLGGRLFIVSWVKWSGPYPPGLSQPAGFSSRAEIDLDAVHLGYFAVLFWRPAGGAVVVPFNAEP